MKIFPRVNLVLPGSGKEGFCIGSLVGVAGLAMTGSVGIAAGDGWIVGAQDVADSSTSNNRI